MASRHIFSGSRRVSTLRNVVTRRNLATASSHSHLHEYVVVIHDKSASKRLERAAPGLPSLQNLSFVGNILGKNPEDIRGDVLACRASSQEEIQSTLKAHPFAKDVWDMTTLSIWPFETVHNSPIEGVEGRGNASSSNSTASH